MTVDFLVLECAGASLDHISGWVQPCPAAELTEKDLEDIN